MIGACGLVAGTSIGAVTVALPVVVAQFGFLGCLLLFLVSWIIMAWTGCLVLEANSCLGQDVSFVSMAEYCFGKLGAGIICLLYACLLYSLLAAYLSGGGDLIESFLGAGLNSRVVWAIFGYLIILFGISCIDRVNRCCLFGLILSFLVMFIWLLPNITIAKLTQQFEFEFDYSAWVVIIAAFGYQVIVPSLRKYVGDDFLVIHSAIFWGSALPFLIYCAWALVVFGSVGLSGEYGLLALGKLSNIAHFLPIWVAHGVDVVEVRYGVNCFIFFAILTSFLGISLSLYDFVYDFAKSLLTEYLPKFLWRAVLLLLVFLPPLLFVYCLPTGFIKVLHYAGIMVLLLNIIFPIMMVLRLRYIGASSGYSAFGGIWLLWLALFLSLYLLWLNMG